MYIIQYTISSNTTLVSIHAEKFFRNLIKSTRNPIVFAIFRLILIQTEVPLDAKQHWLAHDAQHNIGEPT